MPLIPAFRRQGQADLCEFKASLIYRMSSKTAPHTPGAPAPRPGGALPLTGTQKSRHTDNKRHLAALMGKLKFMLHMDKHIL